MFLQWCYLFYYVTSKVSDSIWLQFLKLIMIIARKGHWIWRLNIVRPLAAFISWKFMNCGIQRYTGVYRRSVQFLFTTSLLSTQKLFFLSSIVLSVIELYNYKLPYIYPFYSRVTKFEKFGKTVSITYWHLRHFFRFKKFLITKNSAILSSYWIFGCVNLLAKKAKIRKSRISGPTIYNCDSKP